MQRSLSTAYPGPDVRMDFIDESGEGASGNDPYDVSLDRFGRPLRYQWETYDPGTGDAEDDLIHIAHDYDRNSNRLYDDRKDSVSYSKAYERDELDRINSFSLGNLERDGSDDVVLDGTTGFASTTALWTLIKEDYEYDALGNTLSIDDHTTTERRVQKFNAANELTDRESTSTIGNRAIGIDFDDSNQVNLFEPALGMTTTELNNNISVDSGGSNSIELGNGSSGLARIGILSELHTGAMPLEFKVKAPSGHSGGMVGLIFGYQSDLDYWLYVKSYDDGEWYV